MDFSGFVLSVISSIVGGIILLIGASFLVEKVRWILTATLGRILNIDTEFVFTNANHATEEIAQELKRAKTVKILTGRGNALQRPPYDILFNKPKSAGSIQIMLPTTKPTGSINWVEQREIEMLEFDRTLGPGLLVQQIDTNVNFLAPSVQRNFLELRFFDAPHFGKIVLTNNCVFFTPYSSGTHGRESHVIKYRAGGDMYNWLNRLFDQLWQSAQS